MPKLKTHKATKKRIKVTKPIRKKRGTAKLIKRTAGQDHFNARESGKITKHKRRNHPINKSDIKSIRKLVPYR